MPSSEWTAGERSSGDPCAITQYAMVMWPRLNRRALARCGCDARRIAAYVARRTSLSVEDITEILEAHVRPDVDSSFFFG